MPAIHGPANQSARLVPRVRAGVPTRRAWARSKRSQRPLRPREFFPFFPENRKKIRKGPIFLHDVDMLAHPSVGHAAPAAQRPAAAPSP